MAFVREYVGHVQYTRVAHVFKHSAHGGAGVKKVKVTFSRAGTRNGTRNPERYPEPGTRNKGPAAVTGLGLWYAVRARPDGTTLIACTTG